jgi:hypothetical protein
MLVFSVTVRQREVFFVLKKIRSGGELTNGPMHMVFPLLGFKTNPGMSSHAPPLPSTLSPGGMAEKPSRSIICIWNICNKGRVPRIASYMSPFVRPQSHACN